MNIEVGQWYRCEHESYLVHVVGLVTDDLYKFAGAVYRGGTFRFTTSFSMDGYVYSDKGFCSYNLIEHLPNCTGPDWKPKKWRKALPEDAGAALECRVLCGGDSFISKLQGFMANSGSASFYLADRKGLLRWYDSDCVEVLDDVEVNQ